MSEKEPSKIFNIVLITIVVVIGIASQIDFFGSQESFDLFCKNHPILAAIYKFVHFYGSFAGWQ